MLVERPSKKTAESFIQSVEHLGLLGLVVDRAQVICDASTAFLAFTGKSPDTLIGKPLSTLTPKAMDKLVLEDQGSMTLADNTGQQRTLGMQIRMLDSDELGIIATELPHSTAHKAQSQLEILFDILPVGISVVGSNDSVTEMNPALNRILRMSPAGVLKGEYATRKYLNPDGTRVEPGHWPSVVAKAGRKPVLEQEIGIVLENGEMLWTSVSAVHSPELDQTIVVTHDITAFKNASAKMERREKFFHGILDSLPGMVGYWDKNLICQYANKQYLVWFGKTPEQMLGIHISELMGPELFEMNRPYIESALKGKVQLFERMLRKADGSPGWTQARYVPDMRDGEIQGFAVLVTEITELKMAQEKIRALNEVLEKKYQEQVQAFLVADQSYRELFASAPIGIHIRDLATGIILDMNERAHEITGYDRAELMLWPPPGSASDVISAQTYPRADAQLEAAAKGEPQAFEWQINRPDGTTKWLDVRINRVTIGGKPRLLVFYQDIDERKQAELRVAELNATLETRVMERTRELIAANEELQSFAYSVSHDLRSPLRALNGYARILSAEHRDLLTADAERLVGMIEKNARRMGNLVDDLLTFARLGQQALVLSGVDMNEAVRIALEEVRQATRFETEIHIANLLPCRADRNLIHQVWANLISNACKYSAMRKPSLVSITSHDDGHFFVYTIQDNGIGFDMKFLPKLFGVFQRLHPEGKFDGTGVGLAIVRRIVERHGGTVTAEGKPEAGAIFRIFLPKEPIENENPP